MKDILKNVCKLNRNLKRATLFLEESLQNGSITIIDGKSEPGSLKNIFELKRKCHQSMKRKIRIVRKFKNK